MGIVQFMELPVPLVLSLPDRFSDINVYLLDHLRLSPLSGELEKVLSIDELERRNKYVFEKDRTRYTIVRGILRHLIANRAGTRPSEVKFAYSDRGKPECSLPTLNPEFSFNVSHTQGYSLIGISSRHLIGIDIEHTGRHTDTESIVASFFTSDELEQWIKIDTADRRDAFFKWWVQKEAYLKWSGLGIAYGLSSFSVDIDPAAPGAFTATDDKYGSELPFLHVWEPWEDCKAAVCVSRSNNRTNA